MDAISSFFYQFSGASLGRPNKTQEEKERSLKKSKIKIDKVANGGIKKKKKKNLTPLMKNNNSKSPLVLKKKSTTTPLMQKSLLLKETPQKTTTITTKKYDLTTKDGVLEFTKLSKREQGEMCMNMTRMEMQTALLGTMKLAIGSETTAKSNR
jgi:hypothetical protein